MDRRDGRLGGSLAALRWAARHSTGRPVRLESVPAESKSAGNRAVNTIMRLLDRARRSLGENAEAGAELDVRTTEITADHDVTTRIVEGAAGW